jgi:hypothetical protein
MMWWDMTRWNMHSMGWSMGLLYILMPMFLIFGIAAFIKYLLKG